MPTSRAALLAHTALVLALGACKPAPNARKGVQIACALDDSPSFSGVCTAQRVGNAVVVRRPDGGFRRIVRTRDGAATDGAEGVAQASDGTLTIGRDRFRLPQ